MSEIFTAPESSDVLTATFTINIVKLYTTSTPQLTDIVKVIEWKLTATEAGETVDLIQKTELADPQPENFVEFNNLTEAQAIDFIIINDGARLASLKSHLQRVLDEKLANAQLQAKLVPWQSLP